MRTRVLQPRTHHHPSDCPMTRLAAFVYMTTRSRGKYKSLAWDDGRPEEWAAGLSRRRAAGVGARGSSRLGFRSAPPPPTPPMSCTAPATITITTATATTIVSSL